MPKQHLPGTADLSLSFGATQDAEEKRSQDTGTSTEGTVRTDRTESTELLAFRAGYKRALEEERVSVRIVGLEPDTPEERANASEAAQRLWGAHPPTFTYLAGAAGCGKTFLAKQYADEVDGCDLVATTGIAAINLGGTTVNSLLGYFDTKDLQDKFVTGRLTAQLGKLWRSGTKTIILDEVSMLDGDQLTFLKQAIEEVNTRDYVLKGKADREYEEEFGAPQLRLMLVGDFAQLPAVKAPFAFESPDWTPFGDHTITLTEVRRQADADFIHALRAARKGDSATVLDFFARRLQRQTDDQFDGATILAKNESVQRYNWLRMQKLKGTDLYFTSRRDGEQRSEWGSLTKPKETWGIPERLHLKIGALVMILANRKVEGSRKDYHYVNGDLGEIVDAHPENNELLVRLQRTGGVVVVTYVRREKLAPLDSARRKELREAGQQDRISADGKHEVVGWIEYLPVRVAYASTVHKIQGLSLDRVQVTIGEHFFKTPGMLYTALSRARSAEGLRLVGSPAMLAERCTVDPRLVGRFL